MFHLYGRGGGKAIYHSRVVGCFLISHCLLIRKQPTPSHGKWFTFRYFLNTRKTECIYYLWERAFLWNIPSWWRCVLIGWELLYPHNLSSLCQWCKKVLAFFTRVKVSILQFRNTLLQVKVPNSKCTWLKVWKCWHQNVLKYQK